MSHDTRRPPVILMADDDEDDRLLVREALAEARVPGELRVVPDGGRLLDYLYRLDEYSEPGRSPRPRLVLVDLNMPRVDGHEALRRIRAEPAFRVLPVVVLTTSRADADIARGYELGANTVITKPASFDGMVELMRALSHYWFEIAAPSSAPEAP